jgi:hypothetical protein
VPGLDEGRKRLGRPRFRFDAEPAKARLVDARINRADASDHARARKSPGAYGLHAGFNHAGDTQMGKPPRDGVAGRARGVAGDDHVF